MEKLYSTENIEEDEIFQELQNIQINIDDKLAGSLQRGYEELENSIQMDQMTHGQLFYEIVKNNWTYDRLIEEDLKYVKYELVQPGNLIYLGFVKRETGQLHGPGTLWQPCGSIYEGEFFDNHAAGFGKYTDAINNTVYIGEFENGLANGEGEVISKKDGEIVALFKGSFKDGMLQGQALIDFLDGTISEAYFNNSQIQGQETYIMSNGCKYVGERKYGKMHGHGTLIYPTGHMYTGQFVYNKFQGRGTMLFPNGDKYLGEWKKGKQHGLGFFSFADCNEYTRLGEFKNGKFMRWVPDEQAVEIIYYLEQEANQEQEQE